MLKQVNQIKRQSIKLLWIKETTYFTLMNTSLTHNWVTAEAASFVCEPEHKTAL